MASTSKKVRQTQEDAVTTCDEKVRYILNFILTQAASGVPIKCNEMLKSLDISQREYASRIGIITNLLEDIYGIKICAVEGSGQKIMCYTEKAIVSIDELTDTQRGQHCLLVIILAYIFMCGEVDETRLYRVLHSLHIDVNEPHAVFGENLKKLIEETFVRQLYLKRERQQSSGYEDPKTVYSWGQRAENEFTFDEMVKLGAKIYDEEPAMFRQRVKMARGLTDEECLDDGNASPDEMEIE